MKKTMNINLGGSPFIIDEDAYGTLQNYLDDIASRLPEGDAEVVNDVESRLAEIFNNHLSARAQVIDAEMVRKAMGVMGRPEEFGERSRRPYQQREAPRAAQGPRRLYRNLNDRWLGGVCSGLAAYLDIDTVLVRIILLVLLLGAGVGLLAYIILWIVLPGAYLGLDGSPEQEYRNR